mmetsp:Transcript_10277/g.38095  ORF Transcript_10277/g.38095 Transcript_10277/m.38095 type:complete len:317 (+) Transcript_10277:25-975(+)
MCYFARARSAASLSLYLYLPSRSTSLLAATTSASRFTAAKQMRNFPGVADLQSRPGVITSLVFSSSKHALHSRRSSAQVCAPIQAARSIHTNIPAVEFTTGTPALCNTPHNTPRACFKLLEFSARNASIHCSSSSISATANCIGPGTAQKYPTLSMAFITMVFLVHSTPTRYPEAQKSLERPYTQCRCVAIAFCTSPNAQSSPANSDGFQFNALTNLISPSPPHHRLLAYTSSTTTCRPSFNTARHSFSISLLVYTTPSGFEGFVSNTARTSIPLAVACSIAAPICCRFGKLSSLTPCTAMACTPLRTFKSLSKAG